ncbi:MAG: UDP-N-acetylmuramoyl-L-alanyl-D-glutamate--2,6-diaminopimelate ligase [Candidatus Doudnabacteria bacterium]
MRKLIKSLLPDPFLKFIRPYYHGLVAYIATLYFGNPSKDLFVIGVTGTAGKSTTVMMLSHILNQSGQRTGYITTVGSSDGKNPLINRQGMSMPGGWVLQKTLHDFALAGCKNVIIECTSEGLAQNRHLGILFSAALFTNLTPAHLDSHDGSFDQYRSAKGRLFQALSTSAVIGVNTDDPNFQYFYNFPARQKFGTTTIQDRVPQIAAPIFRAQNISVSDKISFDLEETKFELNISGAFNVSNALLAIGLAFYKNISIEQSSQALQSFGTVPGRMETIANQLNATIIVDYAPEPAAMEASLAAVRLIEHKRLIHLFGSTGGHRDVAKRFEFGRISARMADIIIITNDDVYESDPEEIAKNIQEGISEVDPQTRKTKQIIVELDRKTAIQKAITMLEPGDLLLLTGKGSEQFLVLPQNKRIDWDERQVVQEALKNLNQSS